MHLQCASLKSLYWSKLDLGIDRRKRLTDPIHSFLDVVTTTKGTLLPGWGCETSLADALAKELKDRMNSRGDTAQLQLSEQALQRVTEINQKMDLIEECLKNTPPEAMEVTDR
jgi:hypothetical protein